MKLALIRHPAPAIAPGICYGRLDVALDPVALTRVGRIASDPALRDLRHVWCSPASRCLLLAEAIALAVPAPLTVDPRLQELDFGDWEGQPWNAVARAELDRWAGSPVTFAPPGGESGAVLIRRVCAFVADLRRDGRDCAIVSHGGPLKVLAALLEAKPADLLAAPPALGSVTLSRLPGTDTTA
jgi:alpha-ribazole phosphatase